MMKDDQVITDIVSNKQTANKLLLHYHDHSSETFQLKYQTDFAKLAEYSLGDTGLLYTPNQFLYNQETIIQQVLPELKKVNIIQMLLETHLVFTKSEANRALSRRAVC